MIGTLIADRYRIEALLGRGGMGTVYQAQDTLLERPVAVKVVSAAGLGTEGRSRLLLEAQAAARLNHPNIVAVYDAGTARLPDQEEPVSFIVMELVEGQTLRDRPRPDLDEAISLAAGISQALALAHRQGIIHRDLKPENVTITSSGTVKLMDFGLARISGKTRLTQQGTFMGTLSYLAPEIILGQEASPASDLYALGVILYEMSAGRPPFEGDSLTAVISQHLYAPVAPPSVYNERIPAALDELILQLLGKRPEDRPVSAEVVAGRLAALSQVPSGPGQAVTGSQLDRLVRGRMIGREGEFSQAVGLWQRAAAGQGQFMLISGEPGIGKSRLVRELSTYAELSGGKTLIGYCYAEERTPYGPIAQIIQSSLENGFRPSLPGPVLADLLSLAPELRLRYPDVQPNERLDPETEQQRMFESIATWFGALTHERQVLLVVDDAHWADSGSLAMLRHLAHRLQRRRALMVATYREVELDEALPFQEVLSDLSRDRLATRIKLARLDKEQTQGLLATLFAEEITPDFLDIIYRETEGNPFFVEEVCKALVDGGELVFEGGRWQRPKMEELQIPQGIRVTIQSRLGKLSKEEQNTLQLAALLGRDFEYAMLAAVSDLDEETLIDTLERAEQAQLIEELHRPGFGAAAGFSFTHALIHSTLLSNLSTLRRQRQQRQVALGLEAAFPKRCRDLAPLLGRYFAEAGEGEKAVEYLLMAGDDARQLYAYDEAISAFEQALLFLRESADHARTARTLMKLGLTYHNIFAFDQSRRAYEEGFAEWQRGGEAAEQVLPEAPHNFRLSSYTIPSTLDPSLADDSWSIVMVNLLFSGLLALTAEEELVPDVAQSWEVLDDGARYVFHLRPDVTWSDGARLTAGDFEYALKRVLDPALDSSLARYLYDIKGAEAYHSGQVGGPASDPDAVGVQAVDDTTLVIHLESASSYFLQLMALPLARPLPRKMVEQHGRAWSDPDKIVTNGPFQIDSWLPAERLVYKRNPDYRGRIKGNAPGVEVIIAPVEANLDLYERDAVDFVFPFFNPVEEANRAIQLHPDEYLSEPSATFHYLTFDVTRPPFDDARIRRALVLAMDRQSVVNRAAKGISFPATGGLVPPGIPGHVPDIAAPTDPGLAQELLAAAGYPGGQGFPVVELLVAQQHNPCNMMDTFSQQWTRLLGIHIAIEEADFYTVYRRQESGPPPLWVMSWQGDYPDPDNYLRTCIWLKQSGWRHQGYETLVNDARRVADQDRRMAMYRQAERILVEEAPVVPISYARNNILIKPWVCNWPSSITGGIILKDVIIESH